MADLKSLLGKTKKLSVLYVEDDKDIRLTFGNILENLFDSVEVACDGLDGLEAYKKAKYDLLITDIKMPKMSGIDLIKEIKKINPDQECVITTAHDEKEYIEEFKRIEIDVENILFKPIVMSTVINSLDKIVQKL